MINQTTTRRGSLPIIPKLLPPLLLLLLLLLVSSRAEAKGLLMIGAPLQYVDFAYSLQKSDTSRTQQMTPSYGLSMPFAVLDQTFLEGSFGGSVNYRQNKSTGASDSSSSASILGYSYNVGGIFLKETKAPLSFFASSSESSSQLDFAPTSTETFTSYGINGIIKHTILPMTYSFRHNDSKSDYGTSSFETVQDESNISLSHSLGELMSTTVSAAYQQTKNSGSVVAANTESDQIMLNLTNTLLFSSISPRLGTLTSSVFSQNIGGSFPLDIRTLTETYVSSLGKGLLLQASYTIGSTENNLLSEQTKSGQISVEHRLFDSLRTRFNGTFNNTSNNRGSENSISSGVALMTYTKQLPRDAVLQLEISDGITVRDSKMNSIIQTQINEPIPVVSISQLYPLKNPRVVAGTIEVRDKTSLRLFVSPNDYDIQVVGQITYLSINPSGAIHTGTVLFVTYDYQSDPSGKYTTDTKSASGSYTLFNGRYLFLAQYSESSSTTLSGGQGTYEPPASSLFRVAARANLDDLIFGVEYRNSEDFSTKQKTVEEYVLYTRRVNQNVFDVQASDSYNMYSTTGATTSGTQSEMTQNTLTIGSTWSRPLFRYGRMLLTTNYQMVRGTLPSRDYVTSRFAYDMSLGKTTFHLDAGSVIRMAEAAKTQMNSFLNLSVRRYF